MEFRSFRLTIYKADDSIYWTEHANDREALETWLSEELTRSYWKPEYRTEIIELDEQGNPIEV